MFDTYVTIVGNVLTAPEWRRTTQSGTLVANFKVASTARRLDRDSGRWVDGNSLRVRVNCWRKLAEGVASSVMVGDPVVVAGRMYTRDWIDDAGNHRTLYELEAAAVGHDLSRGRARFLRNRPNMATSTVEDAEAETRVRGEATEAVPAEQAPRRADDRVFDDDRDLRELPAPAAHRFPPSDEFSPASQYPPSDEFPPLGPPGVPSLESPSVASPYSPGGFDEGAGPAGGPDDEPGEPDDAGRAGSDPMDVPPLPTEARETGGGVRAGAGASPDQGHHGGLLGIDPAEAGIDPAEVGGGPAGPGSAGAGTAEAEPAPEEPVPAEGDAAPGVRRARGRGRLPVPAA